MGQGFGSNGIFSWNNKEGGCGGFSASQEFQNSLFDFVNPNNDSDCGLQVNEALNKAFNKKIKLTPTESTESSEQVKLDDALTYLPPLGLTLRKTASLLDFMNMKLFQESNTNTNSTNSAAKRNINLNHDVVVEANENNFVSQPMAEKLKASNFPALYLRIGSYEVKPEYEGDLVAKCYFAKRKLVWEVLQKQSKRKQKIEIQWSDVLAIKAIIQDNEPGILEIELNQAPSFYEEENPTPRKHTNWKPAADFTHGQALYNRRHYVKFPPGALDRHYEKLLQCDHRLFMLSRKPFPSLQSAFFHSNALDYNEFSGLRLEIPHGFQFPLSSIPGPLNLAQQRYAFQQTTQPSLCINDSTSPVSVMDLPSLDENISNHGVENPMMGLWGQGINNFADILMRDQTQELPSNSSATQVHPTFSCQGYQMPTYSEGAGRPNPGNRILSDIENDLLSDTQVLCAADDQAYLSRVKSLFSVINLSEEANVASNTGTVLHMNYGQNADDHLVMNGSTEHSNGTGGLLYPQVNAAIKNSNEISNGTDGLLYQQQPICWMPSQVSNKNLMMHHQPRNNSFYSSAIPDPRMEDFDTGNTINGINHWA